MAKGAMSGQKSLHRHDLVIRGKHSGMLQSIIPQFPLQWFSNTGYSRPLSLSLNMSLVLHHSRHFVRRAAMRGVSLIPH